MKLYNAELDARNFDGKAAEWWDGTDESIFKDSEGNYYIGYNTANVSEPYTFDELQRAFTQYQEDFERQEFGAVWEAVVNLMDDEIREEVHRECAPCSKSIFFDRYCELHEEKYGEEFAVC